MPRWAKLTVTAVALLMFASAGYGVYFRFGRSGLIIAGAVSAYLVVRVVIEVVGAELIRRLLVHFFRQRPTSKSDN